MPKTKLVKAAGRFGARYGQHIKRKIVGIESKQRLKQICPFCESRAKRVSKGVWNCKRCGKKFAAHAYFIEPESIKVDLKKAKSFKEKKAVIKEEETKKKEKPKKKTTKSTKSKKK